MDRQIDEADRQQAADNAEAVALARFLVMRETFMPCWGESTPVRVVVRRHRRRPQPR